MVARTSVVGLLSVAILSAGCGKWLGAVFGGGDGADAPWSPPDPGPPTIAASVADLRFSALQGGAAPEAQVIEIGNDGGGTLAWTASTGGASWLQLSATSGTAPSSLSVAADVAGLAPGVHTGTITLSADGASNTPLSVPVTLAVLREVAFAALETHLVGSGHHAVASADFNGDGRPDLAVTAESSGTVAILLGREIGGLGDAREVGVGVGPTALTAADFDGDAVPDLAVANGGGNSLTVLLGAGDGTFGAPQTLAVGSLPFSIAHGDFDGDGDQDLAIANAGDFASAGTVSVMLGAGDGTFGAPTSYGAGYAPIAVVAGDFDGDATPDLAVADYDFNFASTENLRILKGDGAGGFAPLETRALPSRLWVMEGADLDGDGTTDLVVGSASNPGVTVLMGTPGGGLGLAAQYATATFDIGAIEVGDFDGDGIPDLVVNDACTCSTDAHVLPGLGGGAFGPALSASAGGSSLCAGDFDQDGNLDLAAADWDRSATVAYGKGDGSFLTARSLGAGLHGPRAVTTGDFDGDGAPDVAAIDDSAAFDATLGNLSLWHGDGAGGFGPRQTFAVTNPLSLAAFDLFQRMVSDLIVAGSWTVSILPGSTAGGLGPATNHVIAGSGNAVAVGFLDSEGYPDLVVSTWTYPAPSGVDVLVGSGSGFLPATHVPAAFEPHAVALGDLNGDSVSDLVVADRSGGFAVLIGTGGGAFGAPTETYAQVTRYLELADFDGDGKLDLVNADYDASEVRLGNGDGTFGSPTAFPVGGASGVVGDFNGDGNKDVALADAMGTRVAFLLGVGDGRFFRSSRVYAAAHPIDFFQGSEVADVAAADFDGDGRADLAYSNGKDSYSGSVSVLMRR